MVLIYVFLRVMSYIVHLYTLLQQQQKKSFLCVFVISFKHLCRRKKCLRMNLSLKCVPTHPRHMWKEMTIIYIKTNCALFWRKSLWQMSISVLFILAEICMVIVISVPCFKRDSFKTHIIYWCCLNENTLNFICMYF